MKFEPMFESMDIEQDQKIALQEAFDKAVIAKSTELMETYVDEKVNEKVEVIEEEYNEKVQLLESSLDGYLDTVVEEFIQENAPSYEAQINDEKAKTLLEMFDNMLTVAGVDMLKIQESKQELDDEMIKESAEYRVEELEAKVADMANRLIEAKEEAEMYLQGGLINEMKEGLSILEAEKFEKLAKLIPFEKNAKYVSDLEAVKESITSNRAETFNEQEVSIPAKAFKEDTVDVKSATDFSKYI